MAGVKKKGLFAIIVSVLIMFAMVMFYGCSGDIKGGENCQVSGHGKIVEKTTDEGETTYTAVAEEWNVFTGWFNGLEKYSDKPTIVINKKTPDGLVAKFETSGSLSVNRFLNGAFNRYSQFSQAQSNYLNFDYNAIMTLTGTDMDSSLEITRGGYFGLNGDGFHNYSVIKEKQETVFASYYTDDTQEAKLYLDLNGRKVSVDDYVSMGNKLFDLPFAPDEGWTLSSLLDGDMLSLFENYIGFRNAVGFIGKVENSATQTKITLNIDKLLNDLKNKLNAVSAPEYADLKKFVEMFTSEYPGLSNLLPSIVFEITINYEKQEGQENISSVEIKGTFEEEYNFAFEESVIKIPACEMSVVIEDAQINASSTPNKVPAEVLSAFPKNAVHAVNVHADGVLAFLEQNVATEEFDEIVEEYIMNFDADINPHFIEDAIKDGEFDFEKIDWSKFGFLSFRITLKDENNASKHGGSTEYLNLYIDTDKFGPKALVNIDLYNPNILGGTATSKYIVNASYDLPKLFQVIPEIEEGLNSENNPAELDGQKLDKVVVANLLLNCILKAVDLETGEVLADKLLFDLFAGVLDKFLPENSIIEEGLSFTEFGGTLAIDEVKDLIETESAQVSSALADLRIYNNLFGEDASHMAIKVENLKYGAVVKNNDGDYVDQTGQSIIKQFNDKHLVLMGVAAGAQVSNLTERAFIKSNIESEVEALVGETVYVEKGLFSDGSENDKFINCQGSAKSIKMKIYRADYKFVDEDQVEITAYLTFADGTIQDLLLSAFDIPYGLIEFKMTTVLL